MKGYIKLHRDIVEHWLWLNPRQLRAWLYLLCEAAWEPKIIPWGNNPISIQRGQLLTTIRRLAGEWGYCGKTTLQFLDTLEKHGMITRVSNTKMTIITVVNYEKYQDKEESVERKPKHQVQHTKEVEENKNKKIIKTSSPSRDGDLKFYEEFFNQEIYFSDISAHLHIDLETVKGYAQKFKEEMIVKGHYHDSFKDLKSHFFNWLKLVIQSPKPTNNDGTKQQKQEKADDKYAARRGTAAVNHKADDYGGAF